MNNSAKIPDLPAIGENLYRERKRQQLSMAELAAASGISKAMLSQIEADKVNPTIATLWKLAHALHVELESLVTGGSKRKRRFEVIRKEMIVSLSTDRAGTRFEVLSPASMAEDLELYRVTMEPGCLHSSQPHAKGTEEYVNVLDGKVRITAGESSAILEKGDFLIVQSDIEHAIENLSDARSELFMVVRFRKV